MLGSVTVNVTNLVYSIESVSWNQYDKEYNPDNYYADFILKNGHVLRLDMKSARTLWKAMENYLEFLEEELISEKMMIISEKEGKEEYRRAIIMDLTTSNTKTGDKNDNRMDNSNFTSANANVDFSDYIPPNCRTNNGTGPSVRRNAPQSGDLPAVDKWRTKLRRES
jgi:hypothetical protein